MANFHIIRLIAIFCIFGQLNAGAGVGKCPYLSPAHISDKLFGGRWYEVKRADTSYAGDRKETCNYVDYSFNKDPNGWYLTMNSSGFDGSDYISTEVHARQPTDLRRTSLGVFIMEAIQGEPQNSLFVLHLESDFALVYFCYELRGGVKTDIAWVLSRDRFPNKQRYAHLDEKLKQKGVNIEMHDVSQIDCPPPKLSNYKWAEETDYEDEGEDPTYPPLKIHESDFRYFSPKDRAFREKNFKKRNDLEQKQKVGKRGYNIEEKDRKFQECMKEFNHIDLDVMMFCYNHKA